MIRIIYSKNGVPASWWESLLTSELRKFVSSASFFVFSS
jgi:hypothetical protein